MRIEGPAPELTPTANRDSFGGEGSCVKSAVLKRWSRRELAAWEFGFLLAELSGVGVGLLVALVLDAPMADGFLLSGMIVGSLCGYWTNDRIKAAMKELGKEYPPKK